VSGTPLARPSVWRLWWSFTWRQAAAMVIATLVLGLVLAALEWLGVPRGLIFDAIPYLTFLILVGTGYETARQLLSAYDIRLRGAHSGEQDHRHRR
jgi:hypothetical protein